MLTLNMLPAGHGDCLWIEYGDSQRPRRILIDGGVTSTYTDHLKPAFESLPADQREFELLILTHVDADHIAGAINMLSDPDLPVTFRDVWFNGWEQIPEEFLSAAQGIRFGDQIAERGFTWNGAFDGRAVMIDDNDDPLPRVELAGGLTLTVISPTRAALGRMGRIWKKALIKEGLIEGETREMLDAEEDGDPSDSLDLEALAESRFKRDGSRPNGSSIGVLLEWRGQCLLLPGDSHAPLLTETLTWLLDERDIETLRLNAFKLPHHGSGRNVSNDLLALLDCERYLVSTNGDLFHHPDNTAMARIIVNGGEKPALVFNYRSEESRIWASSELQARYKYKTLFPAEGKEGYCVSFEDE